MKHMLFKTLLGYTHERRHHDYYNEETAMISKYIDV